MKNIKNISNIIKALADEGRLRIVILLLAKTGLCVCEIKEVIGLSQPTISSHLKQLVSAGILDYKKEGLWVNYSISEEIDSNIRKIIENLYILLQQDGQIKEDIRKIKRVDRKSICQRKT